MDVDRVEEGGGKGLGGGGEGCGGGDSTVDNCNGGFGLGVGECDG